VAWPDSVWLWALRMATGYRCAMSPCALCSGGSGTVVIAFPWLPVGNPWLLGFLLTIVVVCAAGPVANTGSRPRPIGRPESAGHVLGRDNSAAGLLVFESSAAGCDDHRPGGPRRYRIPSPSQRYLINPRCPPAVLSLTPRRICSKPGTEPGVSCVSSAWR